MSEKKKGIDISVWQGNIDAGQVKSSGIEFVILREGFRQTVDSRFFENVKKCNEVGLPVMGVYHFSYALNVEQAKQEAQSCVANLQKAGLGKDTIVFFDFEYDTVTKAAASGVKLGRAECNAHTKAFCETVESLGYRAGIYFNIDYYRNWYDHDLLDKYVRWLADWSGDADYPCSFHQYSSKGSVPGINGNVDMNYYFIEDTNAVVPGVTANAVLDVARGWLGYSEANGKFKEILDTYNSHKPLARGYAIQPTDEWCDAFVSACAIKAGAVDLIGTEVGCEKHIEIFKKKGIWIEDGSVKPEVGDVILFNWDDSTQPNDGYADHIGYVEQVYGDTIVCIEGNKGEKVDRRTINVGWGYIRGFARPKYSASSTVVTPVTKKTVDEIANEVIQGAWGNSDARKNALAAAGYNYAEIQGRVNAILSGNAGVPKKSVDEVAKEVIAGKWGNGDARKTALTKAGYNYSDVQNRVNALVSSSKKSVDAVAREVIQGKWGVGEDRKNRLTKAGYDYSAVQRRVNELM
ncbi:MAG: CHAP domain-containing protein [Lachnospiraceae bacterium]|nr:CHAP domain-containing protein [Lachnospiraceae bacterium]